MRVINNLSKTWVGKCLLVLCLLCALCSTASADLEGGMQDLQGKILSISTPLAIIFLIIAAWQKAMGNDRLFFAALIGTIIMFSAPQIVDFISLSFGV